MASNCTSLSVLSSPILALRQHEHEQALSFLTCEEKRRVYWGPGKAPQPPSNNDTSIEWDDSLFFP